MNAIEKRQPMPKHQQRSIMREMAANGWQLYQLTKKIKGFAMPNGFRAKKAHMVLDSGSLQGLLEIFKDGEPDYNRVQWQDIPGLTVPMRLAPSAVSDVDFEEGNG